LERESAIAVPGECRAVDVAQYSNPRMSVGGGDPLLAYLAHDEAGGGGGGGGAGLADERMQLLEDQVRFQQDRLAQLDMALKESEKGRWELEMRRRMTEDEARKTEAKLRQEIAALSKQNVMIAHRDNQYKHDLRKREREMEKLQERLARLTAERGKEARVGMELLNALRQGAQRVRPGGVVEADLHAQTVAAFEERVAELGAENAALRKSLAALGCELQAALAARSARPRGSPKGADEAASASAAAAAAGDGDSDAQNADDDFAWGGVESLPFDADAFETAARARLQALRKRLKEEDAAAEAEAAQPSADQVATLRRRVQQQREVIEQQERLLQAQLMRASPSGQKLLEDSRRLSLLDEVEGERARLREASRRQLQQAAELDAKRKQLAEQQRALERQQREWDLRAEFPDDL
jgi:uncharacterized protein (DUF2267 family)